MKNFLLVSLIFSFVFAAIADENKFDYMGHRKFQKNKEFKIPKLIKKIKDYSEAKRFLRRTKKLTVCKSDDAEFDKKHNKSKKRFFKKLLKKLENGPINIEEIDNGISNTLKLKFTHKKNKYLVKKVNYKLQKAFSKKYSVETYEENGDVFADIDVATLPLGEYRVLFRLEAEKIRKKPRKRKKKKLKQFLATATFEKTQSAFAIIATSHEADKGHAQISAAQSYSNAGAITKYIFNVYFKGALIDTFEQEYTDLWYSFKDIGLFEVDVTIEDDKGNKATSEKLAISITNSVPVLQYQITQKETPVGHFAVDMSSSYDLDGDPIQSYEAIIFDENWGWITGFNTTEPIVEFAAPKQGAFKILLVINDPTPQADYAVIDYVHEGPIAPKYTGHYFLAYEDNPTKYGIGASFQSISGIKEYHFTATHEDGTVAQTAGLNNHTQIHFSKTGNYTLEIYAIDNDGLKSDVHSEVVNIHWEPSDLIPVRNWHYAVRSEHDRRTYWVGSQYTDYLGEVVRYDYVAVHSDGTTIDSDRPGQQHVGFVFPKDGSWDITVKATDNEGFVSEPFTFNVYINYLPEVIVNINKIDEQNYKVDLSNSIDKDGSIIRYDILLSKNGVVVQQKSSTESVIQLDPISESAFYDLRVTITDNTNEVSEYLEELIVILPGDDVLPPMPDEEENNRTIAGIDRDSDGIRDDIENYIFDKGYTTDQRSAVLQITRTLSIQVNNVDNKEQSIQLTFDSIGDSYCLISKLGHDQADLAERELKAKLFNTRDRLFIWAKSQINFAGQQVVLDTKEENYNEYCK